ncbi:hypothetical protein GCM10011316_37530 [Roseibium aquae]|uniref:AbrB family transcriptional regulator n=1 Tax=Roseibium aquae TaxID=1323746 RepID=A0A916TNF2_9HYPH|nr:AbrB family transcriptional regulator [Roseibium aquae]GGB62049.1 hypothetical protein GCM10011316_37530 [Roseibium aquae]
MIGGLAPAAATLAAGLTGAALAALIGVPAGALIGSTLAVGALATSRIQVGLPVWLRNLAFGTIGVSLGSGVDERLLDQLGAWGISLAILTVSLIATIITGRQILMSGFGLDKQTATLASSPGTMSNAIAIAAEGRGDATAVMFLQLMRLLVLVFAVPPLAMALDSAPLETGVAPQTMSVPVLGGLLALTLAAGTLGSRLGVPAASLLAGVILSAAGHATGLVHGAAPALLIFLAFATTGAVLGSRLSRVSTAQMKRYAAAGAACVGTALVVSLAFAFLAAQVTGLPFSQVWIAYAPGGVEAMAAIGLSLGLDPAYVAVHHFARIFALILIVPIALKL